jgi:hypothetical protein
MVGIVKAAGIPSASNDFVLAICGFDIIPFAVAGSSDLAAITVTPANPAIPIGVTLPFKATGVYGDGNHKDVTSLARWDTSDEGVAIVSNEPGSTGVATSTGSGTVTISAAMGAVSGKLILDVRPWIARTSGTELAR